MIRNKKKNEGECPVKERMLEMAGGCPIEEWMLEHVRYGEFVGDPCDSCPVMVYINKLAGCEDREEEHYE